MRKLFLCLSMLGMLLTGCSKDDDNETPGLPPLPDPDDVCSCMDDLAFMQYCYDNFDVNKDGKVSITEANAVTKMEFSYSCGINSCTGIGYFSNLADLKIKEGTDITFIDLSNNTKLTYCDLGSSAIETVILPRNLETCGTWLFPLSLKTVQGKYISNDGKYFVWNNILVAIIDHGITSYSIPDNITTINHYAFYNCFNLESITIPESVTKIGAKAFYFVFRSVEQPKITRNIQA